eukprot:CAMPEP_0185910346 /NCGR_PEP_ID=MMETSP0196C-20130402/18735_1 /TAXON_ID=2932 /ORGANISM="Alexandrium fundyense, Strain CCMP1719" /LENGTH=44 /DNA_ID= /DNA_START= /DNA_END= /DNA_ORIENTATION=
MSTRTRGKVKTYQRYPSGPASLGGQALRGSLSSPSSSSSSSSFV